MEYLKAQDEVLSGSHAMEVDSIANTSLSRVTNDVHYIGRQEHKIILALAKRLISIILNELKGFGINI
jgi:hypothetical protein